MKFEEPNRPAELENPSSARVNMIRQKRETPKEASTEKAKMPMDRVPITKTGRSEACHSQTTEGSKEQMCEPIEEEEKRAFQDLVWNLEPMLDDQNKYITTLIEEHDSRILKRRRALESNDA